jgi:hypothetical protein
MLGREEIVLEEEFPPALRALLDYIGPAHSLESLRRAADALTDDTSSRQAYRHSQSSR